MIDTAFFTKHYEQTQALRQAPQWSQDAYERFVASGLPSRQSEAWRYAKLAQWFSPERQAACSTPDYMAYQETQHDADIIITNGRVHIQSTLVDIVVLSLQEALEQQPAVVERHIQRYFAQDQLHNPLADFALAAFQDGLFIQVPPGYRADVPLRIVHDYTSSIFSNFIQIVDLGVGSKMTILEHSTSPDNVSCIHNAYTSVQLDAGAEYINERLQMVSQCAVWHDCRLTHHENTSQCAQRVFALGALHAREENVVDFRGDYSVHEFAGVSFSAPQAEHMTQVSMLHRAHHCRSNQQYRSLVAQRAENSFLGHITVPKQIVATTAYQDSKSMLLDALARTNIKPYLTIFADDVVCTHSAAVGQLDKKALFYLQARGMTTAQAYAILLDAFVQEILVTCIDPYIRAQVAAAVEARSQLLYSEATS